MSEGHHLPILRLARRVRHLPVEPPRLSPINLAGGATQQASFGLGSPAEFEPNNTPSAAGRLLVGGYVHGEISSSTDVDFFSITLPAGQYTFETSGWLGGCGCAFEVDTVLELYDSSNLLLESSDAIDEQNLNFCSRITRTLPAGTYHLRMSGWEGNVGTYRLEVRRGN